MVRRLIPLFALVAFLFGGTSTFAQVPCIPPLGSPVAPNNPAASESEVYAPLHTCFPSFGIPYTGTLIIIVSMIDQPLFSLQSLDVYSDPTVVPYLVQFSAGMSPLPWMPNPLAATSPYAANLPNVPTVDTFLQMAQTVIPGAGFYVAFCGNLIEDYPYTIFSAVNNYYLNGCVPPNVLFPGDIGVDYEMTETIIPPPAGPEDIYPFMIVYLTPANSIGASLNLTPI